MKKTIVTAVALLAGCSSSGPQHRVEEELVYRLPEIQQQKIARIGLMREDAQEQKEKALKNQGSANDALDMANKKAKAAGKNVEAARAVLEAAEARQDLEKAKVQLAEAATKAAEQNMKLSLVNYELEKARAVHGQGLKSSQDIGLIQFEQESYETQKALTETNLRTVEYQQRVTRLEKEWAEKNAEVQAAETN